MNNANMNRTEQPRAPQPQRITVKNDFDALHIIYRWWSGKFLLLLIFCVAWDSFLVFWYIMVSQGAPWIMIVFPIGHVAVGIGLTYYTIAGFVNRTTITIDQQWLTVVHGPLPWFGGKRIEVAQIHQLYAEEIRSQNNRSGTSFSYQLNSIFGNNMKLKLLPGLPSADIALFIEQSIEEYLHISNRPVIGELSKTVR